MNEEDRIFYETLMALSWHYHPEWGDRAEFDVLTRLLAKNIKRDGWTKYDHVPVKVEQVQSRREFRTTKQLSQLSIAHTRDKPQHLGGPIIVFDYEGEERLLDGNTRINYWLQTEDTDPHLVHVHWVDPVSPREETP